MRDLTKCNGWNFSATICGTKVFGRIKVSEKCVFLCYNEFKPRYNFQPEYMFGYKYAYLIIDRSGNYTVDPIGTLYLRIWPMTFSQIEEYKDWQEGDKVQYEKSTVEIIFRHRDLVVCKDSRGVASPNSTCDELYKQGFRIVSNLDQEDDYTLTLTKSEIAEKFGINPNKLRIKEE